MTDPTPGSEQLNLKVKSQDGEEVFFKIKATTQLKKLMDAYCQRQSVIYFSYLVINQQCSIPFRWIKTSWNSNTKRTQHGKRRWNWCRRRTSRRKLLNLMKSKNKNKVHPYDLHMFIDPTIIFSFNFILVHKKNLFLVKILVLNSQFLYYLSI